MTSIKYPPSVGDGVGRHFGTKSYLLPTDDEELERLTLQHEMLKRDFNDGELLPPSLSLHPGDCILDAGTGTGAWAIDAALHSVHPSVHVTALDISPRLFPPHPPANTTFALGSITSLPELHNSTFTLVHSRLLVGALSEESWRGAIEGFFRVLKPGGVVVLEELDMVLSEPDGLPPDPPVTASFVCALKGLCTEREIAAHCLPQLVVMLREAGFVDVKRTWRILECGPGETGRDARETMVAAIKALKMAMVRGGGFGFACSEEEYDALMAKVENEWETGHVARKFISWTARKPLS